MSLRKSACLTPQRLDAQRRNSQRSTGPRSEAGKERTKMNALQHGCDAAPENEAAVMRALGEDPERYAALQRELSTTYGPGDALWDQQLADLARLYWRRNRIERMQTGLMRRALLAVEERKRTRRDQIAAATFDASSSLATDPKLAVPAEPCARLRQQLSRLTAICGQLRRGVLTGSQQNALKVFLPAGLGWRPARIDDLMWMFLRRSVYLAEKDAKGLNDFLNQHMGGAANVDNLWRELVRLLEEEAAAVQAAFEEEMKVQEEMDEIERDACLAPAGETWEMLLRQEMALDRSIDRKVRIILTMRQEHARSRGGSRTAPTREADDRAAEVAPNFSSAGVDLKVSATDHGTESPAEESAAETPKSPEQSQNVIENKAPAAEEVAA